MTRDEKRDLINRLHEIWNTGDLSLVPSVYAEVFVVHWSKSYPVPESRGLAEVIEAITRTRDGFPDWHEKVVDMIIEDDRVVTRYISTGTHHGPFAGQAPSGARVEIDEISIYRVADGKVAEQWCQVDDLTLMRQISS